MRFTILGTVWLALLIAAVIACWRGEASAEVVVLCCVMCVVGWPLPFRSKLSVDPETA